MTGEGTRKTEERSSGSGSSTAGVNEGATSSSSGATCGTDVDRASDRSLNAEGAPRVERIDWLNGDRTDDESADGAATPDRPCVGAAMGVSASSPDSSLTSRPSIGGAVLNASCSRRCCSA